MLAIQCKLTIPRVHVCAHLQIVLLVHHVFFSENHDFSFASGDETCRGRAHVVDRPLRSSVYTLDWACLFTEPCYLYVFTGFKSSWVQTLATKQKYMPLGRK